MIEVRLGKVGGREEGNEREREGGGEEDVEVEVGRGWLLALYQASPRRALCD